MIQINEILKDEFEQIKQELIKRHDELGMRASGQWANSLEVKQSGLGVKLFGLKYSEQLEYGRRTTKSSTAGQPTLREAIEKWIVDKGLASRIQGKISISSLAFLIARKIHREGWKRKDFGGVELISQVVTAERIQKILDRIEITYLPILTKEIKLMYA